MLPEINILPLYDLKLEVLDKHIGFHPFTVEQEKAIILAIAGENASEIIKNYQHILQSCVNDEIDWDSLSVVDFVNLVVNIRAKSKGENLDLRNTCSSCSKQYEFSVNLENSLKHRNVENKKAVVKIHDRLTLELKPLGYQFLFGIDGLESEIDVYMHTAAHCVSKMIYDGKIYKITDTKELTEKVLSVLEMRKLAEIFEACKDLISIYLSVNSKCPFCSHEEKEVVVTNFLGSLS